MPPSQCNRLPRAQSVSALQRVPEELLWALYCKRSHQVERKIAHAIASTKSKIQAVVMPTTACRKTTFQHTSTAWRISSSRLLRHGASKKQDNRLPRARSLSVVLRVPQEFVGVLCYGRHRQPGRRFTPALKQVKAKHRSTATLACSSPELAVFVLRLRDRFLGVAMSLAEHNSHAF